MNTLTRKQIFAIKEKTAEINTGCFNKEGKFCCKRADTEKSFTTYSKGCCLGCYVNKGYLWEVDLSHLTAKELRKLWGLYDTKHGFWSSRGCVLPRKWRSITCVGHYCYEVIKPIERDKLNNLLIPLRKYNMRLK